MNNNNNLLVYQWNACSLIYHSDEFKHHLDTLEKIPDIICIQETFFKSDSIVSFPGYVILRKDGLNGRRGVATLIRKEISYYDFKVFDNMDAISIKIKTINGPLEIINVYISPCIDIDKEVYLEVFQRDNVLICGDFNAKSTLWGSPSPDYRGKIFESILDSTNLVVLNNGLPTRIHSTGESHIDLSFSSPRFANAVVWDVLDNTCGSDHNIVSTNLFTSVSYENIANAIWLFEKADWFKFSGLCDDYIHDIPFSENLEFKNEKLSEAILKAAEKCIPRVKGTGKKRKHAYYWNEECSQVIKNRDSKKRIFKRTGLLPDLVEFKKAKAIALKVIKRTKRSCWRRYASSLSDRSKLGEVWRVVKNMNKVGSSSSIPALKKNDVVAHTLEEKSSLLGAHFARVSSSDNYSSNFREHKNKFENDHEQTFSFRTNNSSVINVPFKMSEFKKALKKCKRTSPGKDLLCYEMFRHMSDFGKKYLLDFFNSVWVSGVIPSSWRHAIIIPLLKPNKDKSNPGSYRPIALTSNICKLMERMIVFRLNWFLEKNGLLNIHQSGFRSKRKTLDQLLRLSDDILKGIGNKKYTLAVFLDIEKAYDMIWKKGVLYKLSKLGIDGNMFNWISGFLTDRSIQVRIGSTLSDVFAVENGVPQGSVISPLLFLIAINDLNPPGVSKSIFADDTAIWFSHRNVSYATAKIQTALSYIQEWCDKWGFKVSIDKTSMVLFHRSKNKHIELNFNGSALKRVDSVKFLGMVFDRRLSWKNHVDYLVTKCKKRINLLKVLAGSKWGADKETMLIVYKGLILSCMDYGCEVYDSATKTLKNKLEVVQNQALRLCSGALSCTSISALQVDCGILPLDLRREYLQVKCSIQYLYFDNHVTQGCYKDCYEFHYGKYREHFAPIALKVQDFVDALPLARKQIVVDNFPFWEISDFEICLNLHDVISKKSDSPHIILSESLRYLEKWSNHLQIYTDGSKYMDIAAGSFYVPSIHLSKSFRLSDFSSVCDAELLAILKALEFLQSKPPFQSVILSDSLSALQAIQNGSDSVLVKEIMFSLFVLSNMGINVSFAWIRWNCW